mgnify:CR=1 FL=1
MYEVIVFLVGAVLGFIVGFFVGKKHGFRLGEIEAQIKAAVGRK